MDTRIILAKIPGVYTGFNYLMRCVICREPFSLRGCHYNEGKGFYCSKSCRGKAMKPTTFNNWKTGRFKRNGYWMLTVSARVYIYEHRYVMEQHLGRRLKSYEVVHHINHDRLDNRLENLELTTIIENSREAVRWHGLRARDATTGRFT